MEDTIKIENDNNWDVYQHLLSWIKLIRQQKLQINKNTELIISDADTKEILQQIDIEL